MSYVDGFVLPVLKKKIGAYRRLARKAGSQGDEGSAPCCHVCMKNMPFDAKRMIYGGFRKLAGF